MSNTPVDSTPPNLRAWILMPALVTFGITVLRLVGELLDWSPTFFSRAPGGGMSAVGIVWLVPLFGAWFGQRLTRAGDAPPGVGRAFKLGVVAILLFPATGTLASLLGLSGVATLGLFALVALVSAELGRRAWPSLGRVLTAYGLAARLPVAAVMLVTMLLDLGTHYDVAPPEFPVMNVWLKWLAIGLLPQITIWMAFTIVFGMLAGVVAHLVTRRRASAAVSG
jgi:hypothetical protein